MIYFIQFETGPIKIGYTEDLDRRLPGLKGEFVQDFVLLMTMDGDLEQERDIHHRFKHLRSRRSEQFRPAPSSSISSGRPRSST